jgi:predicted enzyme related to lactoylglutathione lyase
MSVITRPALGSPCWLEIATPDTDATARFYGCLFSWEFDDDTATLFGEPVAGLRRAAEPALGWTPYLATPDIDATARLASRYGGRLAEHGGDTAILLDPTGTAVGLCRSEDIHFTAGVPGSLVWAELVTWRATLADRFFGAVFGYGQKQFGDGRRFDHMVWYAGEDSVLARVRMALGTPEDVPARWIAHFAVDPDVGFDATVHLARRLGARLRFKPYRSALGRVAVLADPLGTRFALIDPDDSDESSYGSVADDPYDD